MTGQWPTGRLTIADLPRCVALSVDRDWLDTEVKWRILFGVGTVFGIEDPAGELVATVGMTSYGGKMVAVSMVLTASRYGRRGLAGRLMEHILAESQDATVFLYATTYGHPLYERLGFAVAGQISTCIGNFRPVAAIQRSRPVRDDDLPVMLALDRQVFGADRSPLLRWLMNSGEQFRLVERDGTIVAYGAAWSNVDTRVIGPVVADDSMVATELIADLVGEWDGPIRIDVTDSHPKLVSWLTSRGLEVVNTCDLMVYKGRSMPGDRRKLVAIVNQAHG